MRVIGLEEHVVFPSVVRAWSRLGPQWRGLAFEASVTGDTGRRLAEIGDERFAAMADTGLDVQVLSLSTPGLHNLPPRTAERLQVTANDAIADAVREHPNRLHGLATLAVSSPTAAADELARAVTELGLDGAMIFSRSRDEPIDAPRFQPVFETAEALNAPLYLHPTTPPGHVLADYYGGFDSAVSAAFASHRLGWHLDTGIELIRLILGGVLDRHPGLRLIVGHWGEAVLFYLDRLDPLAAIAHLPRRISEYVRDQVYVTPSGMLSPRYLQWTLDLVGPEHVLFATDYPFEPASRAGARAFLDAADLTTADRSLIASGNWDRLRADIRR